jgi:hypothetical protein
MYVAHSKEVFSDILAALAGSTEARHELGNKALQFLKKEYLFDGNAGTRAAQWLESFTKGTAR